jgi:hypothetical protein
MWRESFEEDPIHNGREQIHPSRSFSSKLIQGIVSTKVSRSPAALVTYIVRYACNRDSNSCYSRGCEVPSSAFFNSQWVRQTCLLCRTHQYCIRQLCSTINIRHSICYWPTASVSPPVVATSTTHCAPLREPSAVTKRLLL